MIVWSSVWKGNTALSTNMSRIPPPRHFDISCWTPAWSVLLRLHGQESLEDLEKLYRFEQEKQAPIDLCTWIILSRRDT